jgi:hypothetical protein
MPAPAAPQPLRSSLLPVLRLWLLALALSALLVVAGHHWPEPLSPDGRLVWALLLMPPGLLALVLWRGGSRDRGESID